MIEVPSGSPPVGSSSGAVGSVRSSSIVNPIIVTRSPESKSANAQPPVFPGPLPGPCPGRKKVIRVHQTAGFPLT